jgi:hypothetical protein
MRDPHGAAAGVGEAAPYGSLAQLLVGVVVAGFLAADLFAVDLWLFFL